MPEQTKNLQSKQTIAKMFGVTTRRIEQLITEGVISGVGKPTKFDLIPTVTTYVKYLSDKANGREKKSSDSDNESIKIEAEARLKSAKAEIAELELKELKGRLHKAEDVEDITTDHVLFFRSMLMALTGKLAVDMVSVKTAAEAEERIRSEIYFVLSELSRYEYDPEEYKKRVRRRNKWSDEERPDDE